MAASHHTSPASGGPSQNTLDAPIFSAFSRTVVLYNWWLVTVEVDCGGKRLAVGGFTSKGSRASRVFTSAPIVRRLDAYTLETADGITVMIQGVINQTCTEKNGFPSEACRDFLIGFPNTWNACANKYFGKESPCINGVEGSSAATHIPGKNGHAFPNPPGKSSAIGILNIVKMRYLNSINLERCNQEEQKVNVSSVASILGIRGHKDNFHEKLASAGESAQENNHMEHLKAQSVYFSRKGKGNQIKESVLGIPKCKMSSTRDEYQSVVNEASEDGRKPSNCIIGNQIKECVLGSPKCKMSSTRDEFQSVVNEASEDGRKPSNCIIGVDVNLVSIETEVKRNQVPASSTMCDLDECRDELVSNDALLANKVNPATSHVKRPHSKVMCLYPRRSPRLNAKHL